MSLATLRVVPCPSTYAAEQAPPSSYSQTMSVTVPRALDGKVTLYSDSARSIPPLIGPNGWGCTATVGADGSSSLAIYPRRQGAPKATFPPRYPPTTQLITASETPGCQGCVADAVCGLFPTALANLGYSSTTCRVTPPAEESDTFVVGSATAGYGTVRFTDPPGVRGTGTASGGHYTAVGALSFGGRTGPGGQTASMACVLPPTYSALCNAGVNQFIAEYVPPKPLVHPTTTTMPPATTTTTQPGLGSSVRFTDNAGDALTATLQQVIDPDNADAQSSVCSMSSTQRLVAVQFLIRNTGTSVLVGNDGGGLTLVDSSSAPWYPGDCEATLASAACGTAPHQFDLSPGDSTVVCESAGVPLGDPVSEVQLAPSGMGLRAFTGVGVWRVSG